jgi:hypothetical protein
VKKRALWLSFFFLIPPAGQHIGLSRLQAGIHAMAALDGAECALRQLYVMPPEMAAGSADFFVLHSITSHATIL